MSYDWMGGRVAEDDWYDQMQVCSNGHVITARLISEPNRRQNHCSECGAKTIDSCLSCNTPIRGYHHIEGIVYLGSDDAPKYCYNCGLAFPWQEAALESLRELISVSELSEAEAQEFEKALPDVINETAKTQGASIRLKRLLPKLGKDVYDAAIKVITDVASETAKKALLG